MDDSKKLAERGLQSIAYSQSVDERLQDIEKAKNIIAGMEEWDKHRNADELEVSYALQEETIALALMLATRLKPHTLPVNLDFTSEDAGKPGIELTADGRIFIIFATGSRPLLPSSIEKDPAVLHQFRERLPAFLSDYGTRHNARILQLAQEMSCLQALGTAIRRLPLDKTSKP